MKPLSDNWTSECISQIRMKKKKRTRLIKHINECKRPAHWHSCKRMHDSAALYRWVQCYCWAPLLSIYVAEFALGAYSKEIEWMSHNLMPMSYFICKFNEMNNSHEPSLTLNDSAWLVSLLYAIYCLNSAVGLFCVLFRLCCCRCCCCCCFCFCRVFYVLSTRFLSFIHSFVRLFRDSHVQIHGIGVIQLEQYAKKKCIEPTQNPPNRNWYVGM